MTVDLSNHNAPLPGHAICFLCGATVAESELSQEHVFAKWLQRRFNLWDKTMTLLNGTTIPYRNLKIPACSRCNMVSLSGVEDRVAKALSQGVDAVRSVGHEVLYLWLAKLLFGILYAEALLPQNRRVVQDGQILADGALERFRFLHFTMQASRTKIGYRSTETDFHSSIFVFSIQEHPDPSKRFMYRDDVEYGGVAVRANSVGLILIMDGGAQEQLAKEVFPRLFGHMLHPLQFEEMTAKIFTKARTMTRTPKYISAHTPNGVQLHQMPIGALSSAPVFSGYDHEFYAKMLADFTDYPLELIWPGDGSIQTWVRSYVDPHFISINDHPWP